MKRIAPKHALEVAPHVLIWIHVWSVRRQEVQLQALAVRQDELLRSRSDVRWMSIQNEHDLSVDVVQHCLQELDESGCSQCVLKGAEPESPSRLIAEITLTRRRPLRT